MANTIEYVTMSQESLINIIEQLKLANKQLKLEVKQLKIDIQDLRDALARSKKYRPSLK